MAKIYLNTDEAAVMTGVSPWTLVAWRKRHFGPRFVRLGRKIAYRVDDLNAFLSGSAIDPSDHAQ